MRNYELMTVFRPDLEDQGLQDAVEKVKTLIAARGGEVDSSDIWGRRRMAYPIRDYRDGVYNVSKLKLDPSSADELERNLHLSDQILRYLLIRLD